MTISRRRKEPIESLGLACGSYLGFRRSIVSPLNMTPNSDDRQSDCFPSRQIAAVLKIVGLIGNGIETQHQGAAGRLERRFENQRSARRVHRLIRSDYIQDQVGLGDWRLR